jgi:hypothetical protein
MHSISPTGWLNKNRRHRPIGESVSPVGKNASTGMAGPMRGEIIRPQTGLNQVNKPAPCMANESLTVKLLAATMSRGRMK